jgi:hypothetical protein
MGYFHIGQKSPGEELINWGALKQAQVIHETGHAKLIRFRKPLVIKIDGQSDKGVVLKQE